MDPRKHNGGVFLGLNGVVVKSHGGTDALGFATAIDVAYEMVHNDLVNKIIDRPGQSCICGSNHRPTVLSDTAV